MKPKDMDEKKLQRELDEKDAGELFERIREHFKDADDDTRDFFSMLVTTSLRYRDMLVHAGGEPLNVGEVRQTLDVFMEVLKTHVIPDGLPKRVHGLVVMLLEELKERIHH